MYEGIESRQEVSFLCNDENSSKEERSKAFMLASHEQEHYAGLARHLGRHLQGLEVNDA